MKNSNPTNTIVIGGGQAGLASGYFLKKYGLDFVILDGGERVGDSWRKRWDSLELFTAARYNSLPGLTFPAPPEHYPNKDEMADYLELYAKQLDLPVKLGTQVDELHRRADGLLVVQAGGQRFYAHNVIIASGAYSVPRIPAWANELAPSIQQLHSAQYSNPQDLISGDVLVVGAASSGTQIALDVLSNRRVFLSGRFSGYIPRFLFGIDVFGILTRTVFNFSLDSPLGRKVRKRMKSKGLPVVDIKESEVIEAGVKRVPRVSGVRRGKPVLEDGQVLDVDVVIWATGYQPDFPWIKLPAFENAGSPQQHRGIVDSEAGLYFVGLPFLYRGKSPLVCGVAEDAQYVVKHLEQRVFQQFHTEAKMVRQGLGPPS